jgi:hypothetical protein
MRQQHCERIPPRVSSGAQSPESSDVPIGMLISGAVIPPEDRICLRGYVPDVCEAWRLETIPEKRGVSIAASAIIVPLSTL